MKQIPRFERQNSVSINIYILEKSGKKAFNVVPAYLTKDKQEKHVNLHLIQNAYDQGDDDGCTPRYRYAWIKDLSRFVTSQLSNRTNRAFFCDRCLHYFWTRQKLEAHIEDCSAMNECKVRLPTAEQANLQFKNFKNKEPTPFADLECALEPGQSDKGQKLHDHIPYSIGYYVKCSYDPSLSFHRSYRGEDCREWFAIEMKQFAEDAETVFLCPLPMEPLTAAQELEFHSISHCHVCECIFDVRDIRVRDHCHLTGKYRGAAHEECNSN
ncbi:hypothetical protein Trydic_g14310 [Trypoxylus dichotomus]